MVRTHSQKQSVIFPFIGLIICLGLICCKSTKYDFPNPVDTTNKEISYQERKLFEFEGSPVKADNRFPGARLNGMEMENDSTFRIFISPENKPINSSPWYAFKIWSETQKNIELILDYAYTSHRYIPKVSSDGQSWTAMDTNLVRVDSFTAHLPIGLNKDTLWIAGQEIMASPQVITWAQDMAKHPEVAFNITGESTEGRPFIQLDIGQGESKGKDMIVIISRQHPPEVTGFIALQAFLDRIVKDDPLAQSFRNKYRMVVFPLMNPDGVDEGHWRHNTGGVDLNRDWAYNHQKETKNVSEYVFEQIRKNDNRLIIGLDFHSTWYDVYYTNDSTYETVIPGFKDKWLQGIVDRLPDYKMNEKPSGIGRPVSKFWFYVHFKAVGVTYEIGDETPREFIKIKGAASAESLMQTLLDDY